MRFQFALLALLLASFAGWTRPALAGHGVHCPRCRQLCDVTVEKTTETRYCWKVQCKTICIPKVTFPWEKNCNTKCGECPPAKCGKVRRVNVLVKHEYECPTCKYTWTPCPLPGCGCADGLHKTDGEAPAPATPTANFTREFRTVQAPPVTIEPPAQFPPAKQSSRRGYSDILSSFFK